MVVDSSALLAILFGESDREVFAMALQKAGPKFMAAANALEAAIVVEARKGAAGGRELDVLLHLAQIEVLPMDTGQVQEARRIWREFGKGNHRAALNFCDCCALALSRISGNPLLYKGEDFRLAGIGGAADVRH